MLLAAGMLNSSMGSGDQGLENKERREMILKNAKSLGNSLGTANKSMS
jgi:hypothetical protein